MMQDYQHSDFTKSGGPFFTMACHFYFMHGNMAARICVCAKKKPWYLFHHLSIGNQPTFKASCTKFYSNYICAVITTSYTDL
jgi:hypothetical protein